MIDILELQRDMGYINRMRSTLDSLRESQLIYNKENSNMYLDSFFGTTRVKEGHTMIDLDKEESEFMLNELNQKLQNLNDKIEYYTSDIARTGAALKEYLDEKKNVEYILVKLNVKKKVA